MPNPTPSIPRSSRLRVILAGHNGDIEVLRSGTGHFSPETLAAAYARISRYPEPVPELRAQAREAVKKARKSNRTIVFGLGHHSVAEHATFNFDILNCSRLAIEALEWHRLCSYTEKSQRYITLDGDFVVPAELDEAEAQRLAALVAAQNDEYRRLLPLLLDAQAEANPAMMKKKRSRQAVEGWAKEDARYAVALATEGQLGFTANARNLELVVRRLRLSPLAEVRDLGRQLFEQAREIAPSLIILADEEGFKETYGASLEDEYFRHAGADLADATSEVAVPDAPAEALVSGDVSLIDHTPDPDGAVISALLFAAGRGSLAACQQAARDLDEEARLKLVRGVLRHLSAYDAPPRAFEEASFRFEIVIDASALAQLKRHRMSTQHWGAYDPALGFTVPPMVDAIGERTSFAALMDRTAETCYELRRRLGERGAAVEAADYALTNAHRRRAAATMNLREVYHFSRLREDVHAQWAIRRIAADMSALVRQVAPVTAMLLAGKDRFAEVFRRRMKP